MRWNNKKEFLNNEENNASEEQFHSHNHAINKKKTKTFKTIMIRCINENILQKANHSLKCKNEI